MVRAACSHEREIVRRTGSDDRVSGSGRKLVRKDAQEVTGFAIQFGKLNGQRARGGTPAVDQNGLLGCPGLHGQWR